MDDLQQVQRTDDEVSLKDVLLRARLYLLELRKRWMWIVVASFLTAGYMAVDAFLTEVEYLAKLTFLVNEDEGKSLGSVGSVLGQFGLTGSSSEYNLEKVKELTRSRKIIQEALFSKVIIAEKEDYLANHLIHELGLHKEWEETSNANFLFTNDSIPQFDRQSRTILKSLYGRIVIGGEDPPLMGFDYDNGTTILTLSTLTTDEETSLEMTTAIFDALSQFYIEQSTGKPSQTYDNLVHKSDSIFVELTKAERELARVKDASLGLIRSQDQLAQGRLERKVQLLTIMYGEVLKNTETANFALKNATPFFQVIDLPMSPLPAIRNDWMKSGIGGAALGAFFAVIFIAIRKFWLDLLNEE